VSLLLLLLPVAGLAWVYALEWLLDTIWPD